MKHGTPSSYRGKRGCRCEECREAHREYMRGYLKEYRRRKKFIKILEREGLVSQLVS